MAPKKGTKRSDANSAPPVAKKPKADPSLAGVVEVVEQAALPDSCRGMLLACIPHCFSTPCGERHESQVEVVKMIGEVVQGVEETLQKAADDESAKVASVEASKTDLQTAVTEAEAAQATATEDVKAKTATLAEAAGAVKSAKASLQAAEETQRAGDAGLRQAQESKAALEKGVDSDLRAIVDGQGEPEQHYQALLPLLGDVGLDESLLSALPSTCKKAAAARGSFDTMVLEQLGTSLKEQIAKLAKTIEEATPAAQERAAAVAVAGAGLEKAAEGEKKAGEELEGAKSTLKTVTELAKTARGALAAFEPEYTKATQARDEKTATLENFRLYNVTCFSVLRDQASAKVAGGGA